MIGFSKKKEKEKPVELNRAGRRNAARFARRLPGLIKRHKQKANRKKHR